ncbi:hypothetical protein Ddye_026945 [Dipteronia dyeriana]|uniref:Uncharacterized protein n=1 Tax=Dipteronia dyeriana TaxID=168575 RepID=A0AAD9WR05_9ROSI|nr:hypothetical protein Ddye_026945 [Dipteronia dyeriana]
MVAKTTDDTHLYGLPIVSKVASFGWKNRKISTSVSSSHVGNRGVTVNRNRGDYIQRGGLVRERSFVETVKGSQVFCFVCCRRGQIEIRLNSNSPVENQSKYSVHALMIAKENDYHPDMNIAKGTNSMKDSRKESVRSHLVNR